ncbi:MAG: Nif3-like dinuclear metal center hexameric protein [Phycisphaeraceae bacterium]|nr:Nif3-like dinuclear metal center hexameric protein [Phycisphaeraceae bacterium]MCW5754924.1 Nif3-like dinuclear metal center hexameric protein [Phycisphaeraceae bacterium]
MIVKDLIAAIERIAPPEHAEPWDKVGLQVGSLDAELDGPVVLTIDLTEKVMDEAIQKSARMIVAYHPPIWDPLDRITDETAKGRILLRAIEHRMGIYTPHTGLDATPGGLTDWLCEGLSGSETPGKIHGDCRALQAATSGAEQVKIVTFVPTEALERVRNALGTAGAGRIGNYTLCTFATPGTGTFLGNTQSSPAVGAPGRLEMVSEHRIEMICPRANLALALETLRQFHPYEEPAIDVYPLEPQPRRRAGSGRRLMLDQPATLFELAERLRRHLPRSRLRAALVGDDRPFSAIGVVPGAGESLAPLARREGCEVFVTGEMRHQKVLECLNTGLSVLLAGHTNTERGYLPRLAERLREALPGLVTHVSNADQDILFVIN